MTTTTDTRERPILFSGPMIRAILDGKKTQTRRVIKPQPANVWTEARMDNGVACFGAPWVKGIHVMSCPYGKAGDRLWVRETWGLSAVIPMGFQRSAIDAHGVTLARGDLAYRADEPSGRWCWRPSIHMPRWASRLTLEIVDVRVERVTDITPSDAYAEGISEVYPEHAVLAFQQLWDTINGARPGCAWVDSPWVWVVSFRRVGEHLGGAPL
jgi:hypothetical protein